MRRVFIGHPTRRVLIWRPYRKQHTEARPLKAMILAAGLGQRMRPLTDHTPKPLLPVADKPLILYHIEKLRALGITELVINIAYLGDKIRQYLGDGSRLGVSIHYSEEVEPLETAGAIHQALDPLGAEPFLLINGDVWSDYSLLSLSEKKLPAELLGHLLLVPNPGYREAGDFTLQAGVVRPRKASDTGYTFSGMLLGHLLLVPNPGYREAGDFTLQAGVVRPRKASDTGYTFSGVSLIRPELVADYPRCRQRFALREVFDWAIAQGSLSGEVYRGRWWDVGTPERLAALDTQLRSQP